MANKDTKINLRIDRTDEHYLSALVKRTAATPSDVIRALIRNVTPDQCEQYLHREGLGR
jgi:hypothetical protein